MYQIIINLENCNDEPEVIRYQLMQNKHFETENCMRCVLRVPFRELQCGSFKSLMCLGTHLENVVKCYVCMDVHLYGEICMSKRKLENPII